MPARLLLLIRLLDVGVSAARGGQLLPRLTLVFICQLLLHLVISFKGGEKSTSGSEQLHHTSLALLMLSGTTNLCGYVLLIALYRHSVKTIFNRNLPSTLVECLPSFAAHLSLLKPLDVMFRCATARFRVLPDILVLGEVRCGTTTLCQHLSSIRGCVPPFCLWKHPELDHKETFYFVGHYLGRVDPFYYRMCFPLAIVKWFRQRVLGKPFFTYDGCAQYLTNPAVPHLIAKTYRDAGQPPPVLVACVRDPVNQAASWWKYENNAMLWGAQMGLSQWNTELRTQQYPPLSTSEALEYSSSDTVDKAYRKAEDLFVGSECSYVLPPWAMTWPGGQLSGIGRNGRYASNIMRYERVFSKVFSEQCVAGRTAQSSYKIPVSSNLRFVNVVPLEFLRDEARLKSMLTSLVSQVDDRGGDCAPLLREQLGRFHVSNGIHRNASGILCDSNLEPTKSETKQLAQFFLADSTELGIMAGLDLAWMAPSASPS